jgi:DNA polymerase III delta prime subunit
MDKININKVLNREFQETLLKKLLIDFEKNKKDILVSRGFYIYGNPGVGKTEFVKRIVRELDYDIIYYNAGDVRNKNVISSITKYNMSDTNILSLFEKKKKKIVILMDEIDGLSNGDKSALSSLIKLVRSKKTKKQKTEDVTYVPIICIGNYQNDKKIKELRKVSSCIELKKPKNNEIKELLKLLMKNIDEKELDKIINNIDGDLRKINSCLKLYEKDNNIFQKENLELLFQNKILNEDTKTITKKLLNKKIEFEEHNLLLNETDRTSISLLFHENIIDVLDKHKNEVSIPFYLKLLDNYSYADYIDRITFQKQIWIYNEISSLMKTIHNNNLLFDNLEKKKYNPKEVRFTKILTKYSTEYNNQLFIQKLTNILNMDKKDVLSYFEYLYNNYEENEILDIFEGYDINKLDIQRIFRFIDSYTKYSYENINEE